MKQARPSSRQPSWFMTLLHWPMRIRWLNPLPLAHRWGIFVAFILILVGLSLPNMTQKLNNKTAQLASDTFQDAQGI